MRTPSLRSTGILLTALGTIAIATLTPGIALAGPNLAGVWPTLIGATVGVAAVIVLVVLSLVTVVGLVRLRRPGVANPRRWRTYGWVSLVVAGVVMLAYVGLLFVFPLLTGGFRPQSEFFLEVVELSVLAFLPPAIAGVVCVVLALFLFRRVKALAE